MGHKRVRRQIGFVVGGIFASVAGEANEEESLVVKWVDHDHVL